MININALQMAAVGLGSLGVASGIWSLNFPEAARNFCREFPRNKKIGRVLMFIDVAWAIYLLSKMDLGDWNRIKPTIYMLGPFIYLFIIMYVNHYLGARSLAFFLILAAKPLIWICFLRAEPSSLVITTLAYIWVVLGICFFSAPHWLRDLIDFWQSSPSLWAWGCRAKVILGCCLILLGIFIY